MSAGPVPIPTPTTAEFWEGTKRGELRLQHCDICSEYVFYPRLACPSCGSRPLEWRTVSGRATLVSYNINHRVGPEFEVSKPQVIALIELDEGPRMMTNLRRVSQVPEELPLGLRLRVEFEPRGKEMLPIFVPEVGP